MGRYVNPGNDGFRTVLQSEYVDKTGMIALMNGTLGSMRKLVLVSRPRRFGKSYAAKMLSAYYSVGSDSREVFERLAIAKDPSFEQHLNAYNVVELDMTEVIHATGVCGAVDEISRLLLPELRELVPGAGMCDAGSGNELTSTLFDVAQETGRKFVFVIDEWDAVFRLAKDDQRSQDLFAEWLRALFKGGTFTDAVVAGAYLTGILPLKKYGHQSAVSDFREYTMVRPGDYAPYVGFTQDEVSELCAAHGMDLADMRRWYDGYDLPKAGRLYAPYSVMEACAHGETGSYWVSTEAYESLRPYIEMDFDGLQTDIVRAVGGEALLVDPDTFQNDMTSIRVKDDVLTLLVHLGYLAYDAGSRTVRVPNAEVRAEMARSVARSSHPKLLELMRSSVKLLDDITNRREDEVAAEFAHVHDRDCSPLFYNNEQALRAVVKTALFAAVDEYARIEELPSGRGYADIAYVPRRGSMLPALLVELKWDKPVDAALAQIREHGYPEVLCDLDVPIVLVGVTYDAKTKTHRCGIEVLDEQ